MRQYRYEVQSGADIPSAMHAKVYTVVCRSWDDFDDTAEAWVRVVNWYTSKETAEIEAKAFQANADLSLKSGGPGLSGKETTMPDEYHINQAREVEDAAGVIYSLPKSAEDLCELLNEIWEHAGARVRNVHLTQKDLKNLAAGTNLGFEGVSIFAPTRKPGRKS